MRFCIFVSTMCLFVSLTLAAENESADLIRDDLEKAKAQFEDRIADARLKLSDDIAKLVSRAESNDRLLTEDKIAVVDELKAALKNFQTSGTMPSAKQLQRAVTSLQSIERIESKRLRDAFDVAASAYDESGDLDAAKAVLAERDEYLQTGASGSTIPPVDLLALIDVSVHAPDRQWRKDGNALVSSPGPFTRIRIPYEPPASYDLQVQVERLGGASDFQIGLRSADRPFTVILDGWGASTSGISSIEGKLGNGNPSTFRGQVFQNQRPAIVKASIRPSGIKVTVDGKPVITWSGNPRSLSRGRETSNSLYFGVQKGAAYRISKAHLIPVTE